MTHSHVRHALFVGVTWWLIYICDMIHSYVWRPSLICATWLIPCLGAMFDGLCDMTHSYVWHVKFNSSFLTHLWLWHDSFMIVSELIHMRDSTHSYVWHGWLSVDFKCNSQSDVTWLVHICHNSFMHDVTHSHMTWPIHKCHDWFLHAISYSRMSGLIHMWHDSCTFGLTPSYTSPLIHTWDGYD